MRMNWFKNLSIYFSYFSWIDKTKHQSEAKPIWLCNMRWHLIPKSRGCYLKKGRETYEIYQIFQSRKKDSRWDKWVCDNELCRISRACSRSRKRKQGRDQRHLTEKVELHHSFSMLRAKVEYGARFGGLRNIRSWNFQDTRRRQILTRRGSKSNSILAWSLESVSIP